jgi:hypothetical protein
VLCQVCKTERFLVYKRYQDRKLDTPRCIGCIIRFPPPGVELVTNSKEDKTYLKMVRKYHTWALIRQTDKLDIWKCPRCGLVLFSPKLGLPYSLGCISGTDYLFKKGFWADVKIKKPQCPLCDMDSEIMVVPRILKHRPGRIYFPYSCPECNATKT